MSEAPSTVASAVVLPEFETTTPTGATKRRRSSTPAPDLKRPRIDTSPQPINGDHPSSAQAADPSPVEPSPAVKPPQQDPNPEPPRRQSSANLGKDEEKRRGKRLFGSLLGTLSQSGPSKTQKRREEVEKKQADKLRQQDEERESEKRMRREELEAKREMGQRAWDEASQRIRHDIMRATAHFLETEQEPKLYYKPWDLLPAQQECIKVQLADVEKQIAQESGESEPTRDNEPIRGDETTRDDEPPPATKPPAQLDGADAGEQSKTVGTNLVDPADAAPAKADVDMSQTDRLEPAIDAEPAPTEAIASEVIAPEEAEPPNDESDTIQAKSVTTKAAEDQVAEAEAEANSVTQEDQEAVADAGEDAVLY